MNKTKNSIIADSSNTVQEILSENQERKMYNLFTEAKKYALTHGLTQCWSNNGVTGTIMIVYTRKGVDKEEIFKEVCPLVGRQIATKIIAQL